MSLADTGLAKTASQPVFKFIFIALFTPALGPNLHLGSLQSNKLDSKKLVNAPISVISAKQS
jgi:hypothetical protein